MSFNHGYVDHSWTKNELKDECRLRGITYFGLNKDNLIHELNASVQSAPPPPTYAYQGGAVPDHQYGGGLASETSSSSDGRGGYASYPAYPAYPAYPNDLSNERTDHPEEVAESVDWSWTAKDLKHECWRRGLRNFSRLNKGRLIRLLNGGQPAAPPDLYVRAPPSETSSSSSDEIAVYAGYRNAIPPYSNAMPPYSNERTVHSEEKVELMDESRPVEAPPERSHGSNGNSNSEGNRTNTSNSTCIVCMDNEVNCTLVPCGHHCYCVNCAAGFEQCPVCRTNVDQKIRTFGA